MLHQLPPIAKDKEEAYSTEEDSISPREYERMRLRIGHKSLTPLASHQYEEVEDYDVTTRSLKYRAYFVTEEELHPRVRKHTMTASVSIGPATAASTADYETEANLYEKAQHETAELCGYDWIEEEYSRYAEKGIKRPSRLLPPENVISRKDAFHAGAKIGSASYLMYRLKDYVQALRKKRPWPRAGKVAYLVDLERNEARNINQNITRLVEKMEHLIKNHEGDFTYRKTKACVILFLLEENIHKLKILLRNLRMHIGLLRGRAVVTFNTYLKSDLPPGPHIEDPFYIERDAFYTQEYDLLKLLCPDKDEYNDILNDIKDKLCHFELTYSEYHAWKENNWKDIRIMFNRYKCGGCITAQMIQGLVIAIINAGIALGVNSPAAAAAAVFFTVTPVARSVVTGVRADLENNLIRHAEKPEEPVTILSKQSSHDIRKIHGHLQKVQKAELIVNQIEGLGNSGFNIAGTLSGLPLSTGRPATTLPPIQILSEPVLSRVHGLWDSSHRGGAPISGYRRGFGK